MGPTGNALAKPQTAERRQEWWGTAYVDLICSQAGFLFQPTKSGGDVHSLDGSILFNSSLPVYVQVKCSRTKFVNKRSYLITKAWRANWEELTLPAYFIHVSVPPAIDAWAVHTLSPRETVLQTAAFWTRIDPLPKTQSHIEVVAERRLTSSTLATWADDLNQALKGFGGGGAP